MCPQRRYVKVEMLSSFKGKNFFPPNLNKQNDSTTTITLFFPTFTQISEVLCNLQNVPSFTHTNNTCTYSLYQNSLICCTSLFIHLCISLLHWVHHIYSLIFIVSPWGEEGSLFNLLCTILCMHMQVGTTCPFFIVVVFFRN